MDLIGSLVSQLKLGETEAKGLAGGVMGLVKAGLQEQAGPAAAAELERQVPEMQAWQAEGDTPEGEPGVADLLGNLGELSGLAGSLGGLLGNNAGLLPALIGMASKFGLDGDRASTAGGLVVDFLKQKVNPELLGQLGPIISILTGGGQAGPQANPQGGGLGNVFGSLLGGLFGKK